jgi:hypothetical protein
MWMPYQMVVRSQTRTAVIATVNESPNVSSTTPSSVCGSGTVTLEAETSDGNINWYDSLTDGSCCLLTTHLQALS